MWKAANPCALEKHLLRHQKNKSFRACSCCYKNNLILALPGPFFSHPSPPSVVVHGLKQGAVFHEIVGVFGAQMVYLALIHKQMNLHREKVMP